MKIGDLVKYNKGVPSGNIVGNYGLGLIIGFVDSGMPNHVPWIKVYWGKWESTTQGPPCYFKVIR